MGDWGSTQAECGPFGLAGRLAAGTAGAEALQWLQRGFAAWLDGAGTISLERCLRLPVSLPRYRLMQRNLWLAEAYRAIEGATPWERCEALSDAIAIFLSRGPWRAWDDLSDPPAGTSGLRAALFYIARFNGGAGLSAKTIHRVVMDTF